jgi:hypothetical protein
MHLWRNVNHPAEAKLSVVLSNPFAVYGLDCKRVFALSTAINHRSDCSTVMNEFTRRSGMPSEKTSSPKEGPVEELAQKLKNAKSVVLADYRGLTVEQDTKLRKALRDGGVEYKVMKNSIIDFAAKDSNLNGLEKYLNVLPLLPSARQILLLPLRSLPSTPRITISWKSRVVWSKATSLT